MDPTMLQELREKSYSFGHLEIWMKKKNRISRWHKGNKEILVKKKKEKEFKFTGIWNNFASKCRHAWRESQKIWI